jgi:hypothetical protein
MTPTAYKAALDAALREYESLTAQRAELDTRLAQVTESIGTLTRLCGLTPTVAYGLTDACRTALRCSGAPMTPIEIRDRLHATGFDLSRYANPLAAIHTVLRRLAENGEAAARPAPKSQRIAFEFRPPVRAARPGVPR